MHACFFASALCDATAAARFSSLVCRTLKRVGGNFPILIALAVTWTAAAAVQPESHSRSQAASQPAKLTLRTRQTRGGSKV